MAHNKDYNKDMVVIIAAVAAVGGLLFGFDTGIISGAIPFLQQNFDLSNSMLENITTSALLGAVIGAMFTGRLTDILGRKRIILFTAIIFTIGALWSGAVTSPTELMAARFIVGLAIGISSFSVPLYISEISPADKRGQLVSLFQLLITIGILASYLTDLAFAKTDVVTSWRPMLYSGVIPGLLLFVGMIFLPETPRWLMSKGRRQEAEKILRRVEKPEKVEIALNEIQNELEKDKQKVKFSEIFRPWLRIPLMIAIVIMFFQQFVGINTVIYYSPKIFMIAGFDGARAAIWGSVSVGLVNVLFTILAIYLVDRWGRRKLYFVGLTGIVIALIALGLSFAFNSSLGQSGKWLTIVFTWIYIAFFAISIGPLGWLIISEVFPLRVRGVGTSIGSLSNWLFNGLVAFTFFKIVKLLTIPGTEIITQEKVYDPAAHNFVMQTINNGNPAGAFWLYAFIGIIGIIWGYFYLPETKGVSLEEIEEHWRKGGKPRELKPKQE